MKNKPLNSFKISQFINEEAYGGILLILMTIVAMIWANSSFYETYHQLWHEYKVGFVWGELNMVASQREVAANKACQLGYILISLQQAGQETLIEQGAAGHDVIQFS